MRRTAGVEGKITGGSDLAHGKVLSRDAHHAGASDGRRICQHAVARHTAVRATDRTKDFDPQVRAHRAPGTTDQRRHRHRVGLQPRPVRRAVGAENKSTSRARLCNRVILSGDAHHAGASDGRGIRQHAIAHAAAARVVGRREQVDPRIRVDRAPDAADQRGHGHGTRLDIRPMRRSDGGDGVEAIRARLRDGEALSRDAHHAGARNRRGIRQHAVTRRAAVRVVRRRKDVNPRVRADRAPDAAIQRRDRHRAGDGVCAGSRAGRGQEVGANRASLRHEETVIGDDHLAGARV